MNDFEKALDILKQVNNLDLTETPIFTWDEMEKEKSSNEKGFILFSVFVFCMGALIGALIMGQILK